jgi:hypothetical protein
MKKSELIADMRRDFSSGRLTVAVFVSIARKVGEDVSFLRAPPDVSEEREMSLDRFLQACTPRQLKSLREIAVELEGGTAH